MILRIAYAPVGNQIKLQKFVIVHIHLESYKKRKWGLFMFFHTMNNRVAAAVETFHKWIVAA